MSAKLREAFEHAVGIALGQPTAISDPVLVAGGTSKEAWSVDAGGERLVIRRGSAAAVHPDALSLEHEFRLLRAAARAGLKVPHAYCHVDDLAGLEAIVMERLEGETIGRRIVSRTDLASARGRLPDQLAEQLAGIHAIDVSSVEFLNEVPLTRLVEEFDRLDQPHPAIELGLRWLSDNPTPARPLVVCHGDFRIGNVVVDTDGLVGILDWELAYLGNPVRDLAWPLVRAWRFGADSARLGGVGAVEPYLDRYNALTGADVAWDELGYWEIAGNIAWAIGCLTQADRHLSGREQSVELAILGRLVVEVEYEILYLLEHAGADRPAARTMVGR